MNVVQQLLTENIVIWTGAETEKKSGRGRAAGNAGSVYGIKKLRELILELAVRGKLVPQDASDEPASELLKRIKIENELLISGGKIKPDRPLVSVIEMEKSFGLPQGWERVRLGCLFDIVYGKGLANSELTEEGYEVFGANGIIGRYGSYLYSEPQLLISCRGAYSGKPNISPPFCFITSNSLVLKSSWTYLNLRFFFYALTIADKEKIVTGSAQPQVTTTNLDPFLVVLPPQAEQHRIVAKVDELMALCDQLETRHSHAAEAHEQLVRHLLSTLTQSQDAADFSANWQRIAAHFDTLFTTEASIDALKQTLLQLAVMGKLVPQDPSDEPAAELLKRIEAEKAKLVAEGKIKKEKISEKIDEKEMRFPIPLTWKWTRMTDLCRPISSGSTPPAELFQYEEGIPFLKVYNIRNQKIDFEYKKQFVSELLNCTKLNRSILYPGDVVMNIVGPPLGKTAIIPDIHPQWNCNQAIVFFGLISPMSNEYILNYLKEGSFLRDIELIGTAGQDNISVTKSKNILVPVPPLPEQHRITAKVNELMALCDQLKSSITDASHLQQKLADVLVEQAVA